MALLDVPYCPSCGQPLSIVESYRARLGRLRCGGCGARLKIPNRKQVGLAIALFLAMRQLSRSSLPTLVIWVAIIGIVLIVGMLEYLLDQAVISDRHQNS